MINISFLIKFVILFLFNTFHVDPKSETRSMWNFFLGYSCYLCTMSLGMSNYNFVCLIILFIKILLAAICL